jgi:hypothetical protein
VREAEDKLKASFVRKGSARAAAGARTRPTDARPHDGLGGSSSASYSANAAMPAPDRRRARAALKDLRLVIDSMDDIGDLMWRWLVARRTAQLRQHDIALVGGRSRRACRCIPNCGHGTSSRSCGCWMKP